jgi:3-polyprenyl-4-hydroxybenzoate decarboxylase
MPSKAKKKNIAIAISGASGAIYAQRLLEKN